MRSLLALTHHHPGAGGAGLPLAGRPVSGDVTRPLASPLPPAPVARVRRRSRWPFVLLISLVVLVALLIAADRAAAAYAASRAAQQMQSHGFPAKPDVTIEGFPFATQVLGRDIQDVHITSKDFRAGPATVSLVADATRIRLDPGYHAGTVTTITASGLISFSSVASMAQAAGAPGLTASADGPNRVKLKVNLQFFTATAIASVTQTGPRTLRLHIISAGGLPASVLGTFSNLTLHIPPLPLGLTIQQVSVTSQGVLVRAVTHGYHFTF